MVSLERTIQQRISRWVMLLLFVSSYVLHKAALFAHGVYHTAVAALARFPSAVFNAVLPILTTFLSVGVAAMPNPVHNLLCLIAVFFSTVLLYLYIGAEFLAFIFLIVYVGAIAILFLFVIMLLQLKLQAFFATGLKPSVEKTVTLTAVVVGLGMFDRAASALVDFFAVSDSVAIKTIVGGCEEVVGFVNNRFADILMFSDVLYTYHASLFFELGLILLTALLGAIVLSSAVGVAEVPTPLNRGLTNPYPRSKLGASPLHSLDPVTAFAAAAWAGSLAFLLAEKYGYLPSFEGRFAFTEADVVASVKKETVAAVEDCVRDVQADVARIVNTAQMRGAMNVSHDLKVILGDPYETGHRVYEECVAAVHRRVVEHGLAPSEPLKQPVQKFERVPDVLLDFNEVPALYAGLLFFVFLMFWYGFNKGRTHTPLKHLSASEISELAAARGLVEVTAELPACTDASSDSNTEIPAKVCGILWLISGAFSVAKAAVTWVADLSYSDISSTFGTFRSETRGIFDAVYRHYTSHAYLYALRRNFYDFLAFSKFAGPGMILVATWAFIDARYREEKWASQGSFDHAVAVFKVSQKQVYREKYTLPEPPVVLVYDAPKTLVEAFALSGQLLTSVYLVEIILVCIALQILYTAFSCCRAWYAKTQLQALTNDELISLAADSGIILVPVSHTNE